MPTRNLNDDPNYVDEYAVNLTINAKGGNDTIYLTGSYNTLNGDAGDDSLWVEGDKNKLNGGLGNDELHAAGNYNTLSGGDGNDLLESVFGVGNTVSGGAGNDYIEFSGASDSVSSGSGDDIIEGFMTLGSKINGDDGGDAIYLYGFTNTVSGGSGNDELALYGGYGNVLNGDGGDDYLYGDAGYSYDMPMGGNSYNGGGGSDHIEIYRGLGDSANGGDGNDLILLGLAGGEDEVAIADVVSGGAGMDEIHVYSGLYNTIHGNGDNDWMTVDSGPDNYGNDLYGDSGNDVLSAGGQRNYLYGGSGQDILESYSQTSTTGPQLGNVMNAESDHDSYILRSTSQAIATTDAGTIGQLDNGDVVAGLLDVIYGYSRGEKIDVDGMTGDTVVNINPDTQGLNLEAGHYAFVRGDYVAEGVFNVNTSTGADLLLVYDTNTDLTQGGVVLVGVSNASNVNIGSVTVPPPPDENPQFSHAFFH